MRNKFLKLVWYCYHLGFFSGLRIILAMFMSRKGNIISLKLPGIAHRVFIRAKSSDEYTFQQIFINKEYAFNYDGKPGCIIDAGANIGLAAVFFANRYPGSRIICLEPETNNYALLLRNIEMYPGIEAIQAGLWNKSTYLKIRDEGLGNWGFIVEECREDEPGALKAISLPDLMKEYQLRNIDIVKMDIEGSEKEVLEAPDVHQWVSACKLLAIELHDRMKKGTSSALFRVLLKYETSVEQKGENLICSFSAPKP